MVVGKLMNRKIADLARSSGIGGLFPWMLNYDTTGTQTHPHTSNLHHSTPPVLSTPHPRAHPRYSVRLSGRLPLPVVAARAKAT